MARTVATTILLAALATLVGCGFLDYSFTPDETGAVPAIAAIPEAIGTAAPIAATGDPVSLIIATVALISTWTKTLVRKYAARKAAKGI